MQIQMHDIEAHVAGPRDPDQRVEVGHIEIHLHALLVGEAGDFEDVFLEESQRVGVGQHDRRHLRRELALQVIEVDQSVSA